MSDKILNKGDICIYYYADGNGSLNIVEITDVIDTEKCKIKCLQVIIDNSGNGWFKYLLRTGYEMTASAEYLHKIEIDREEYPFKCKVGNNSEIHSKSIQDYDKLISDIANSAISEFSRILLDKGCNVAQYLETTTPFSLELDTKMLNEASCHILGVDLSKSEEVST